MILHVSERALQFSNPVRLSNFIFACCYLEIGLGILVWADLEYAVNRLSKGLSMVIVKNGRVLFETRKHGLSGLIEALDKYMERLRGASIADKVVGKAAALLIAYAGIVDVYASILSIHGMQELEKHGIHYRYGKLVKYIAGRRRGEVCPFERLTMNISDPAEAYRKIKFYMAES